MQIQLWLANYQPVTSKHTRLRFAKLEQKDHLMIFLFDFHPYCEATGPSWKYLYLWRKIDKESVKHEPLIFIVIVWTEMSQFFKWPFSVWEWFKWMAKLFEQMLQILWADANFYQTDKQSIFRMVDQSLWTAFLKRLNW